MSSADLVFGGRYRILGEVGRGGMGVIYRGVDSVLDREVAIKVMSADYSETTDETRARFFREAKAAARLQHRNIVTVFEFAEQDGVPYIVMEFLKGRSLSARMAAEPPMSLDQKLDLMTELCNGLQFAHENGVVHRDVKPANVWLLDDGAVKLVDFGIAKLSSSMTMHGDVMGSASYMSPEQIEGASVTGRSDVFSAAVLLYEMVARRRPFEGDSPTATMMQIVHQPPPPVESIVPDLPKDLIAAIAKGLEKNPDDRYQSAAEFGDDLQLVRMSLPRDETILVVQGAGHEPTDSGLLLKAEPLPARSGTPGTDTRPMSQGKPGPWITAAAVALVAIVGIWFWLGRSPEPGPGPGPTPAIGGGRGEQPGGGPPTSGSPGPADPALSSYRLDSTPRGADVIVDGVKAGITPADLKVAAGATVVIQMPTFQPRKFIVTEADLQRGSATYTLSPVEAATVQVAISGEYRFEVWEGGRKIEDASQEHIIPSQDGRTLTLKSDEHFLNHSFKVEGRRGRMTKTAPALGSIFLTGNESCMVYLAGRQLEYLGTPFPQIASGDHTFTFKCAEPQTVLKPLTVPIRPGDNGRREVR